MLPFQHDPQMLLEAGEVATEARQTRDRRAKHAPPRRVTIESTIAIERKTCRKCRETMKIQVLVHAYAPDKGKAIYPQQRYNLCGRCGIENYAARHPDAKWLQS